ncbi:Potassium-transporting ATPase potassium-binding subunit [Baekduia alba]|uniref:potassium-transporting ATPase subunit KdpA n=1 Tax=Baekduia alba TaxID=2997333 RepID=UPI0023418006|nr:potassium-transporting ATPase subunit KdpA [Baekduia alba]WCB93323.1 Potassium-transporting ATPase potassium-binding subunit [Baekduia alba]
MGQGFLQIAIFLAVVVAVAPFVGAYMARVFSDERVFLTPVLAPVERVLYRLFRVDPDHQQDWKAYAKSLVVVSVLFAVLLYVILRTQGAHPFNPEGFKSGTWDVSFNTASSFLTNTNWQFYGGETTMSYFSQMAGLAVQNFVSAAVGIAVLVALIRGIVSRRGDGLLGNFYKDLTRIILYILVPLSVIATVVLVSQGVLQTLGGTVGDIARGPVASQEAIKMLGTNGGGFFNVNSAYPFENPTAFSNFVEMFCIMLIPASLPFAFGRMVGNRRQGWVIFGAMSFLFVISVVVVFAAEQHGTPAQHLAGLNTGHIGGSTGGNLEGKDQRFGIASSSLFTAITTVISCGAVNTAFQSLTGLGGLVPMANLGYSESVFGGVGTGLYMMLLFVLLAVFIGGLMVGRTPEYLGKKLEPKDVKLVSIGALFTALIVLVFTGLALSTKWGAPSIYASGPQGFSETFYAYLSQANNNGSAFAGYTGYLQPNAPGNVGAHGISFADVMGGFAMLFGRFVPIIAVLAVGGGLARKKVAPAGLGTMRTDTPTFGFLLVGVVVLIGALTFLPAFLLGPVVQSLTTQLF